MKPPDPLFMLWPPPTFCYYQSSSRLFWPSPPLSLLLSQTPIMKPLHFQPTPCQFTMIAPMPTLRCPLTLSSPSPPRFRFKFEFLLFSTFRLDQTFVDLATHSQGSLVVYAMLTANRWASAKPRTKPKSNPDLRLLMGMITPISRRLCPLCICPLSSPLMASDL